jgi:hypothetical protein
MYMAINRKLSQIARRASGLLLLGIVLSGSVAAQEQLTVVKGKVTVASTVGSPFVPQARVQVMDPDFPKAKRVSRSTQVDGPDYEIENVAEGKYDIVACDDQLKYEPRLQSAVEVRRNGREVNFRLKRNDPAHPFPYSSIPKSKFLYLKHIETGCELDVIRADSKGTFSIPNIVDEGTLISRYFVCFDDTEEANTSSTFESCRKRELPIGLPQEQVFAILGKGKKFEGKGHERIYRYQDVRVTLVDGKVSDVRVEINPSN